MVGDRLTATTSVTNNGSITAPMVILDLPVPAGFAPDADEWRDLQAKGQIARYEMTPRSVIVYLRGLEAHKPLTLRYHLTATMPVKITSPSAEVYEYYDPDNRAATAPTPIMIRPRA